MESNKADATRCKDIAELKLTKQDLFGAQKLVLKEPEPFVPLQKLCEVPNVHELGTSGSITSPSPRLCFASVSGSSQPQVVKLTSSSSDNPPSSSPVVPVRVPDTPPHHEEVISQRRLRVPEAAIPIAKKRGSKRKHGGEEDPHVEVTVVKPAQSGDASHRKLQRIKFEIAVEELLPQDIVRRAPRRTLNGTRQQKYSPCSNWLEYIQRTREEEVERVQRSRAKRTKQLQRGEADRIASMRNAVADVHAGLLPADELDVKLHALKEA